MSDQKYSPNDSYNELLRSYSAAQQRSAVPGRRETPPQPRNYPPMQNRGGQAPQTGNASVPQGGHAYPQQGQAQKRPSSGISFDRPNNEEVTPRNYRSDSSGRVGTARQPASMPSAGQSGAQPAEGFVPSEEMLQEIKREKKNAKKKKKRAMRRRSNIQSILLVALVLVFVFVASMMLKIPIMGCVNDLLATDRTNTEIRVELPEGLNVDQVIDLLADKGLIYSGPFCKLAAKILDYSENNIYEGGTYNLSPSMGLEGMLNLLSANVKQGTVTLTFPEGYTVDQIIAKLSENKVASAEALYEAMDGNTLIEKYDFLLAIEDRNDRYSVFEGYLFPDTYEFYVGDDPVSVLSKFLDNFANHWSEEYDENCIKLGMTVDEIVTLASILEKEANDSQQMPLIASILFNRIRSTSFAFINCDSTNTYLESIRENVPSQELFEHLTVGYDTYVKTGLPVGAICNPGADALYAAMHPENTDYYYFLHDANGNIYVARTAEEHEANIRDHLN